MKGTSFCVRGRILSRVEPLTYRAVPNFIGLHGFRCYCPFRGCAGDWVKLGVAKRHGADLGDAICLNSSLPCVLVDVVRCKMGKFSCCVPGCTNNWRNLPEKSFTLCRVMLKSGVCMKNSYGTRI